MEGTVLLGGEDLYSANCQSGHRPAPGRYGIPKIQSVPDIVDWRKRHRRIALERRARPEIFK